MTDPAPAKAKRSKVKTVGIIIGIVIGVAVAGIAVIVFTQTAMFAASNSPNVPTRPAIVTVSGQVTTVGLQTHPVGMGFIDQSTGERESIDVVGNHYQVDLPNGSHNWRVVVAWEGLAGSKGTCDAGFVQYDNTFNRFLTQDISC